MRAIGHFDLIQYAGVWMVRAEPAGDFLDALCRLAGLERCVIAQIIKRPARMRLHIGERLVLAGQIGKRPRQQGMFVNIRQISCVIDVLITEHGSGLPYRVVHTSLRPDATFPWRRAQSP